jgi:PPOX class probable F420-dependent enzyme
MERIGYLRLMARTIALDTPVDRAGLEEFIRPRHNAILSTQRGDGAPQMSPVTMGVDPHGTILVASYPERAKVRNLRLRLRPRADICVLSDGFTGEWVQVSGRATLVDRPDALEGLMTHFLSVSGEHSDWKEYRQVMIDQGEVLIRLVPEGGGRSAAAASRPRLAGS